ncbi:TetR/AcrR family transcriptional regulator [Nocardia salmonicida]|uniref:TetR/AcrR family transcriptional regulator n=1 Tax=Nocardia salmonicida TaxID=53431 RepID=UPI0033D9C879
MTENREPNAARRLGRPTATLITRESAIDSALKIVDEEGADALSIRRIAKELNVTPGSLYHHFSSKEEILAELTMHLLRKQRIPREQVSWQETFINGSHQYRKTLLEHPNAAPILASRLWQSYSYAKFEHSLASMAADGLPEEFQLAIMRAGEMLGLASALIGPDWDNSKYGDVPDEYPALRRALDADTWTAEESFDMTIRALVVGFETLVEADRGNGSPIGRDEASETTRSRPGP